MKIGCEYISLVFLLLCICILIYESKRMRQTKETFIEQSQDYINFIKEEPYTFTNMMHNINRLTDVSKAYTNLLTKNQVKKLSNEYINNMISNN